MLEDPHSYLNYKKKEDSLVNMIADGHGRELLEAPSLGSASLHPAKT